MDCSNNGPVVLQERLFSPCLGSKAIHNGKSQKKESIAGMVGDHLRCSLSIKFDEDFLS